MMTLEYMARRYRQIADLERQLALKASEVRDCKAHLKELEKDADAILSGLRAAARDEGELPLLDMMAEDELIGAGASSKKH